MTEQRLKRLIDALEVEILGTPEDEIGVALADTGRLREAVLHEVRASLVADIDGHARGPDRSPGVARPNGLAAPQRSPFD